MAQNSNGGQESKNPKAKQFQYAKKKIPKLPNSNMLINPKMQTGPLGYLNSNKA